MNELPFAHIDPHVRRAGRVGLKEYEVAGHQEMGRYTAAHAELLVRHARQRYAVPLKDRLDEARTVDPWQARSAERVRNAEVAHRSPRDPSIEREGAIGQFERGCARKVGWGDAGVRGAPQGLQGSHIIGFRGRSSDAYQPLMPNRDSARMMRSGLAGLRCGQARHDQRTAELQDARVREIVALLQRVQGDVVPLRDRPQRIAGHDRMIYGPGHDRSRAEHHEAKEKKRYASLQCTLFRLTALLSGYRRAGGGRASL